MDKVYRSKVDWWVGLIIGLGVVVILGNGIFLLVKPPPGASPAILAPIAMGMFLMAAFMAWILFSTRYTITARDLLVRSAFIRWRIPLDQIIEVFPTHNPLSSPALSLDRLRVNYERSSGRTRSRPRICARPDSPISPSRSSCRPSATGRKRRW